MQADVILKEPPSWVPPLSLSGGARVEGVGGPAPPRTPLFLASILDTGLTSKKMSVELKLRLYSL